METKLAEEKKKITDWVNHLNDENVLEKLTEIMKQERKTAFDKEFEKGISGDELLKRVFKHIDSLPWKK